ncbi:MAG: D-glycero-beta-D-manno-heptose-7-phosphate kinase [Arcobacteraceae bacterium]|jgi:D-beta-D-heptose 7-phosphate kinase/D-beta-D-heptose 1-phosphate adenosyltransferase|nr:D-glycero-beta-D-manno-heptose-7-phosphate kinase [Arcobacteraceae bacterium]MDY0364269.1 D-glycero-beta-D-manno-heptose-7-phosphate kinase [Arcobacteraceae bacterium]
MPNKGVNICVIGDLMIDHYLWGSCDRISPEAPVQVVDVKKETTLLGGAGNVVNNLVSLGANVVVLSVIGDDEAGSELEAMLKSLEVKTLLSTQKNRKTSKKSRILVSNQQVVRYDKESKDPISQESIDKIKNNLAKIIDSIDVILLSDYGKGVLTNTLTKDIIDLANKHNKKVLIDPKGNDYSKYANAYLLTPNKKEASLATNIEINSKEMLLRAITKLKNELDLGVSLITLSEDGIAIYDDKLSIKPTVAKEVFDVTGAGDTVLASLGYMTALGKDIYESVEFANLAAGVVVSKVGSATATLEEIEAYRYSLHKSGPESHIKTKDEMIKIISNLKTKNKKIVFTNGCFDILHRGHVSYLDKAKSQGDILVLGLNSDSSVKRLKGEDRPINNEEDRAFVLAALESVDYVVIFEEDTPYELIKALKPHILVKGADYKGKDVVGADLVEELKLIEFINGKSTTNTIAKIKGNLC